MDHSLLDFAGQALGQILGPHLLYLLFGVVIGLVVGILPGLGGISGMALVLPFVYGMDQTSALAMMIGLTSVTTTSDTFPSVLMGVPGSSGSQATVLDGFPLAQKGEGARALAAAFTASLFGGVFGAIVLSFAFIFARPLLLAVGFAEQMMLVVLALSLVGLLTGRSMVKGLAACGIGLLIGTIGPAVSTGEFRMTLGSLYLLDGLPLLVIGLGLFAVPEILDVLRHKVAISERGSIGSGWLRGVRDVFNNKWLVLRCSTIGALIGALPGLGGTVIDWIAYAHVIQTTKDKSQFGKGDIRGVIAPESANNAKEGGALIPTLFLGIPGSGSMALFLGGLVLIGITPGRTLVTEHVDLVYVIIWSIAIANVLGALICVALSRPIASLTAAPFAIIAPFMITMIYFAGFQTSQSWGDIGALVLLGVLGIFMKRFGWSRAALLIGFVLAPALEASVSRTVQIYGFNLFLKPTAMVILVISILSIFIAWRSRSGISLGEQETTLASYNKRSAQFIFAFILLGFTGFTILNTMDLRFLANVFPISVAIITAVLVGISLIQISRGVPTALSDTEAEYRATGGEKASLIYYFGWFALLPILAVFVGFFAAAPIYVAAFLHFLAKKSWKICALGSVGIFMGLWFLGDMLSLKYPSGWLMSIIKTIVGG